MKEPIENSVETIEKTPDDEKKEAQATRRMKVPIDTQTEASEDVRMETPVNAPVKERYRIEIAKLRQMTFKNKVEYIWEYYKVPIIIFGVLLALIGSLINTIFINPPPKITLAISWNAGYVFEEQLEVLSNVMNEQIIDESKNERVDVLHLFFTDDDPMISMANIQRLAAMVAAGQIDIFIVNSLLLEDYSINGYLQPMDEVLSKVRVLDPEVYSRIEERLTSALFESEDRNVTERIMGIDLSDSPLLSELGFFEQERFLSISITAGNIENAARAIIAFFS